MSNTYRYANGLGKSKRGKEKKTEWLNSRKRCGPDMAKSEDDLSFQEDHILYSGLQPLESLLDAIKKWVNCLMRLYAQNASNEAKNPRRCSTMRSNSMLNNLQSKFHLQ